MSKSKDAPLADAGELETPQNAEPVGLIRRRSFLATGLAVGAGASLGPLGRTVAAFADTGGQPTLGDIAILRFLAAAEILETDLWQQYNELGGIQDSEVPGGSGSAPYIKALETLDEDMPQYIHDNTDDEHSHFHFINAYLESKGAEPVNLDKFRELPSSKATGAQQIGRLTNLMELSVDTSFWTRYRSSTKNPDLGDEFAPAVPGLLKGKFPAIPRSDSDLAPQPHLQAIANTAGFHFAFIEQGGSSLYPTLARKVTNLQVLRILLSIGPSETMHFQTWQDKAGNALPLTDVDNGPGGTGATVTFTDLSKAQGETNPDSLNGDTLQANLIMPEPCDFIDPALGPVAIVRPTSTNLNGAVAAVLGLVNDGLFIGQPQQFVDILFDLAHEADIARREF